MKKKSKEKSCVLDFIELRRVVDHLCGEIHFGSVLER